MSREIFEDTIRLMVATGTGITKLPPGNVVPGLHNDTAPETGLFASVTMTSQRTMGLNPHYQFVSESENDRSYRVDMVFAETAFDVNWFRDGAVDAAMSFRDFVRSESGKNWAATANVDGRIKAFNVYDGGAGYRDGSPLYVLHGTDDDETNDNLASLATGTIQADENGSIYRILLNRHGYGYRDIPRVIAEYKISDGVYYPAFQISPINAVDDPDAQISALGFGFSVANIADMTIMRLDEELGGRFEERAYIGLVVHHTYLHYDTDSGDINQVLEDPPGVANE